MGEKSIRIKYEVHTFAEISFISSSKCLNLYFKDIHGSISKRNRIETFTQIGIAILHQEQFSVVVKFI